jgi:K+-transporting ATPase ATPase A chain
MEGKETRFGISASALFAAITTAASCGAVNAMHDSFTPLGGMVPMVLMQFGEVVFGGVGSGLYGMLIFAILAVFIAGLMIGRTPEYLGKKIEAHEMKLTSIAILVTPILVLAGTAIAVMAGAARPASPTPARTASRKSSMPSPRPANNNGSAFAGLSANTPFYNTHAGCGHVVRPLRRDRAGPGDRRRAGRQEAPARHRRHHAHARPAVRGLLMRHRAAGGRAELRARRWRSARWSST